MLQDCVRNQGCYKNSMNVDKLQQKRCATVHELPD